MLKGLSNWALNIPSRSYKSVLAQRLKNYGLQYEDLLIERQDVLKAKALSFLPRKTTYRYSRRQWMSSSRLFVDRKWIALTPGDGEAFSIKIGESKIQIVDDLKKAIKLERPNALRVVDAAELVLEYPLGTTVLASDDLVSEIKGGDLKKDPIYARLPQNSLTGPSSEKIIQPLGLPPIFNGIVNPELFLRLYDAIGRDNWFIDDSTQRNLEDVFAPTEDFKRVGRGEELKTFWVKLLGRGIQEFAKLDSARQGVKAKRRTPCMYFQASPGVGKTYLLREVVRRNPDDMSESMKTRTLKKKQLIDNLEFLGISFNGVSSIDYDRDDSPSSMIVKRLFYSEFVNVNKVSYEDFIMGITRLVGKDDGLINEVVMQKWLHFLLNIKFPGKTFILLVDELVKLDKVSTASTSQVRSLLCRLADDQPSLGLLFVVFSSLRLDVMEAEVRASGRELVHVTKLPLLSVSDASNMLHQVVNELCTFRDGTREEFVRRLAEISGGHARTVEYMRNVIVDSENDPLRISQVVHDAEQRLRNTYRSFDEIPFSLVETALIGDRVKLSDIAYGKITYEDLVAEGVLIGSEDKSSKDDYAPVIPEIILYTVGQKFQRLRDMRTFMMLDRYSMNSLSFEDFHIKWEQLRRSLMLEGSVPSQKKVTEIYGYNNASDFYSPSLAEVVVEDSPAPLIFIQATALDFTYFKEKRKYTVVNQASPLILQKDSPGRLFRFPKDHPGSEFCITYRKIVDKSNNNDILRVYIQNKRSDESSTTQVNIKGIKAAWNHTQTYERGVLENHDDSKWVLVIIGVRGFNLNCYAALKDGSLKDNIILLEENPRKADRKALTHMYGSQFGYLLNAVAALPKDIKMFPPDYFPPNQSEEDI